MSFYQDKINEIENLIKIKAYKKALNLIEYEFNAPYLPVFFEKKLRELIVKIETIFALQKKYPQQGINELFSFTEIKKILLQKKFINLHPFIFSNLDKYNLTNFLPIFEIYLQSDEFSAFNKTLLLFLLQKQQIDHLFLVKKNQQTQKINPINLENYENWPLYQETLSILSKRFFAEDQVILNLTKNILTQFYCFFYPWIPNFIQAKALAGVVTFHSLKTLGKPIAMEKIVLQFGTDLTTVLKVNQLFKNNDIF